jgi:hypothetical protein
MKVSLPEHIPGMLNKVPEDDQPKGEEEAKFWRCVAYELAELMKVASHAQNAQIVLNDLRQAGEQFIWEFCVNDLSLPKTDAINWHGQYTSQWLYAGCILLQNGKVSTHH